MGRSSTEILVEDLERAGAPRWLTDDAKALAFHDYRSKSATPLIDLYRKCRQLGLHEVAENVKKGKYDATKEESDDWAKNTEEGREAEATLRSLGLIPGEN